MILCVGDFRLFSCLAEKDHLYDKRLREVIANLTEGPILGFIGESVVNVVLLNLALDEIK